jgi:1,4-alpha-glucan branching enzyme
VYRSQSGHGVSFRVWAPFADQVWVATSTTNWLPTANKLYAEGSGYWSVDMPDAESGMRYKFVISNPAFQGGTLLWRMDPYASHIARDAGHNLNAVVAPQQSAYSECGFTMPSWNVLVVYELDIWTFFVQRGLSRFESAILKLDYLKALGVNAIEIMPIGQFLDKGSEGYNPAYIFAIEDEFGGPDGFRDFVNAAHARGIAVIVDVVYSHLGVSAGDMWQFDGWSQGFSPTDGGVYFYNDWRAQTNWGDTRFDYGRGEVRQYLRDNAMRWLQRRFADGLRFDAVGSMRNVYDQNNDPANDIPEGWSLLQWINADAASSQPWKITIAEDLNDNEWITKNADDGGAGFAAQWGAGFLAAIRDALVQSDDSQRDMNSVAAMIGQKYNGSAFQRVIFTESHDADSNGSQRVPEMIWPANATSWFSKKRSTLGAAVVMAAPGIPMLFMGQEFLSWGSFSPVDPLDWTNDANFPGIVRLYRDLISLRKNSLNTSAGLTGQSVNVFHVNDDAKLVAFHRWDQGGAGDDVVVVLNFADVTYDNYSIGFPRPGMWQVRFNSDWSGYDPEFGNAPGYGTEADGPALDGLSQSANIAVGPYTALIFSQNPG